jgi:hypothetical protein
MLKCEPFINVMKHLPHMHNIYRDSTVHNEVNLLSNSRIWY